VVSDARIDGAPRQGSAPGAPIRAWLDARGWRAFPFQERVWDHYLAGRSGLVHAPTGAGKTLAVWGGPLLEGLRERGDGNPDGLRVVWITPLRALATDTVHSLLEPLADLGLSWTVEHRTGDTAASVKSRQRDRLPTALVTTPESATVLLADPGARERLSGVRCIIVDEWHELMSTKRGTQTELVIARMRAWNPGLRVWGLSATLGNLREAMGALVGTGDAARAQLVTGDMPKAIRVESVIPASMERFPWSGHLGTKLVEQVASSIESARTTLVFTNTRSQTELWFRALAAIRPDWPGEHMALHHGSIDREVRAQVEDRLRAGTIRCAVCTSSLDLGVDFSPVDQVIQVGSPKGIARLVQRAGRSGHQPGATSRVLCVPAHALELVEFAAARRGAEARAVEARTPVRKPLDVLVQHMVTAAMGGGFDERELYEEVRSSHAYADLSRTEFGWALDFVTRGGAALGAYPQFHRVTRDEQSGRLGVSSATIARLHKMAIGTITSDASVHVRFVTGGSLGTIEESFISRLKPGDRFVFGGRTLELVRLRDMTAQVRLSNRKTGAVPQWQGGRTPLSTLLAGAMRSLLDEARRGEYIGPEMEAVRPVLELQRAWSVIPGPDELLIETTTTRSGAHAFLFPFQGRLVHEGLASVIAHRIARERAVTILATVNDYGIEILTPEPLGFDEAMWRKLLRVEDLLADLLVCLNSSELARRRFRDVARVAGLIHPGYPGAKAKGTRHLQASSELFFDVFAEFDPANLLLDQARREVLEEQLEVARLRAALESMRTHRIVLRTLEVLTPLAFPLWAESLRSQHVSSESWQDRIARMVVRLETEAGKGRRSR